MSFYSLTDFKTLVTSGNLDYLNTRRLFNTLDKLDWDEAQLMQMLTQLEDGDFQKTVHNCRVNDLEGSDLIHADQYEVHWDEETRTRQPSSLTATVSLSLKIAIFTDSQGRKAGLVTTHLSGSPW